jgi:transcription elongation factor GreA
MRDQVLLTAEGLETLRQELHELKTRLQPEVVERIKRAKEYGDLAENSEYDDAKNEQGFVAGRIAEIEEILKQAKVVERSGDGVVELGSHVTVHIDGDEEEFTIVGAAEADPMAKKISHESPLGRALLGKTVGARVEVDAPVGKITYTVKSVH